MRKYTFCRVCDAPILTNQLCCGELFCKKNLKRVLEEANESCSKRIVKSVIRLSKPLIRENNSVTLPVVLEIIKPTLRKEIPLVSLNERSLHSYNIANEKIPLGNYCLYCENKFGTTIYFHKKVRILTRNRDHFIPIRRRKYTKTPDRIFISSQQLIDSCQICNSIKGSLSFPDFLEAKHFILDKLLNSDWRLLV